MIDIHCHILPGMDDGPAELDATMKMLRIAEDDGVSHIIATPHYRCQDVPTMQDIDDCVALVRDKMEKSGLSIQLLSGADIRLTYELLDCISRHALPTINGSRYFLLELPDLLPPHFDEFIFEAKIKGYVPIITHPERNYTLFASPRKSELLRESGALLQITAMSITGEFGKQTKKFALQLLNMGCVDFVASDAHGTSRRVPVLSRAYREVSKFLNQDEARKMFIENPAAVVENRELR
jgi:protein-tyrosine phosphatase